MSGPDAPPGPGHDEALEELAVGWALHALEPADAERFAAHSAGCARCREVVAGTTEAMAALAEAAPAAEPPPALRDRLRAEVARTPQDGPAAPVVAARGPAAVPVPRRRWTTVLVAAALAAVVGLGGWVAVLAGDRDRARQDLAAESAVVDALLEPGRATLVPVADGAGRDVATLVVRDEELQVVSHGLPVNDAGARIYVLWGLDRGAPQPLGSFDVTGSGPQVHGVAVEAAGGFPAYGISIEPGRRPPAAPTDVVAQGTAPR